MNILSNWKLFTPFCIISGVMLNAVLMGNVDLGFIAGSLYVFWLFAWLTSFPDPKQEALDKMQRDLLNQDDDDVFTQYR